MKKIAALVLVNSLSACSGIMASDIGQDNVLFYGSSEAIRSYWDGVNGLAVTSKMPGEANDSPHFQLRRLQSMPQVKKAKDMRR